MSKTIRSTQATSKQDGLATSTKPKNDLKSAASNTPPTPNQAAYFIEAQSWADDLYTAAVTSRNRYQFAFLATLGLVILLAIALNGLIPLQHLQPLLIHHYPGGQVSVQPVHQNGVMPVHPAQVESEIVRYIIQRESFDATSYDSQYQLVHLLSSKEIAKQYEQEQSRHHPQSPLNLLGRDSTRTVHIESIVFLDSTLKNQPDHYPPTTHYNLAQVNFHLIDHAKETMTQKTTYRTALVSWVYRDPPVNPSERWQNWDGFTMTRYTVAQRNV